MGETTKNLALISVLCIFGSHYIFDKQWLLMAILLKPNLDHQILLLFIITYLLVLWILLFALVLLFNPNPTFLMYHWWIKLLTNKYFVQKQPSRGALKKRCFENMQQIYRITPMPKCDLCNFIEITLRHWCSPVNCCIFSEHLFLVTPLGGCFSMLTVALSIGTTAYLLWIDFKSSLSLENEKNLWVYVYRQCCLEYQSQC